jgi:hypothetical protein
MTRAATLEAYLAEVRDKPFDWSRWNCCTFVAGWVQRMTGTRVMMGLPKTPSRMSAHRLIVEIGGNLRGVWSLWMHRDPILPTLAQTGDIVCIMENGTQAVGVCCGRTAAVLTEDGVHHVSMEHATCAWRVECVH